MTEAEWLACSEPEKMLGFLTDKASERKLRLFAVACYRRVAHLAGDPEGRAVEVAEQAVEGMASKEELATAHEELARSDEQMWGQWSYVPPPKEYFAYSAASSATLADALRAAEGTFRYAAEATGDGELQPQAALLRDVFGNPFRPVSVNPSLFAWNNHTISKLAQAIYDERAFDRLPILADALEDAGCSEPAILNHCRSGGEHVRGCWTLDLLLGKE
jgi:hypothetical protein